MCKEDPQSTSVEHFDDIKEAIKHLKPSGYGGENLEVMMRDSKGVDKILP